ncbi:hypothetical protein BH708_14015 [Brachybacterium sp. P6-10-X1]|uniref:mycothiol transferase n=1 Tax=Brachybacterium sp. P6-10-X1 TaxID=1903186 RepID=UPI000971A710|nr:DUF664 domain-containing protein [Brachybacterium sp. P6-10-X1]APX33646.1 hypothetical protein BH708_14015 [Brachybacterium sp. P6-10-X1]
MPFLTAETTHELDSLATFAGQQIEQVATALHGLTPAQIRQTPSASAMSLGALARHVILVSDSAAMRIAAAPGAGDDPQRTPAQFQAEGGIAPEAVREEDTAESLIAELQQVAEHLTAALRASDPEAEGQFPDQPWFEGRTTWTVRWYALHQIEENARHAGHADILRESIDGKGAYELNALAAGQEWPPAGW